MTDRKIMPYKWEMLGLLWFAFLFNQADRAMFGFVMPLIKEDMKLTDIELGIVATTFHVFYALLAPLAGYMGDIFRRSRIIVASITTQRTLLLVSTMRKHGLLPCLSIKQRSIPV